MIEKKHGLVKQEGVFCQKKKKKGFPGGEKRLKGRGWMGPGEKKKSTKKRKV